MTLRIKDWLDIAFSKTNHYVLAKGSPQSLLRNVKSVMNNWQARSQRFAMGGLFRGSGGGAPSRRRPMGVWGQSAQPPEAGGLGAKSPSAGGMGSGGSAPSVRKFCIFLQK